MLLSVSDNLLSFLLFRFFNFATDLADWTIVVLTVLWFLSVLNKNAFRRMNLSSILIPVYITTLITLVLKTLIHRGWPEPLTFFWFSFDLPFGLYSFPSGHASRAFALATALGTRFPQWKILLFLLMVLIGLSRIYLGAHDIVDVLAGAALGISISLIYGSIVNQKP